MGAGTELFHLAQRGLHCRLLGWGDLCSLDLVGEGTPILYVEMDRGVVGS
jgi:hypothetical protein